MTLTYKAEVTKMKLIMMMIAAVSLGALGCSQGTSLKQTPVSVSGKVFQAGQPVGDILVSFHPLDNGHLCAMPVKPDGTFQGELIAGDYAYYVGPSTVPNSAAALKKIDPKYYAADMERSIAVAEGQELAIALD